MQQGEAAAPAGGGLRFPPAALQLRRQGTPARTLLALRLGQAAQDLLKDGDNAQRRDLQ